MAPDSYQRDQKIRELVTSRFGDIARLRAQIDRELARRRDGAPVHGRGLFALGASLAEPPHKLETARQIVNYIDELRALSDHQLDAQFGSGHIGLFGPMAVDGGDVPAPELFNESVFGSIDVEHWARSEYWTTDEAIALSLGVEPGFLPFHSIRELFEQPISRAFSRCRDLVMRAVATGALAECTPPIEFVIWAQRRDVPFPPELSDKVIRVASKVHGEDVVRRALGPASAEQTDTVEDAPDALELPKLLGLRERDTFLTMLIAMAVEQYGYVPSAGKSDVPSRIVQDVSEIDLSLHVDTVRKKLQEATELLSRDVVKRIHDG